MPHPLTSRIARCAAVATLVSLSVAVPNAVASPTRSPVGSSARPAAAAVTHTLTIAHQSSAGGVFSPSTLTIRRGDTVTVHNADTMFHTVTSYGVGSNGKPLFDLQSGAGTTTKLTIASSLAAGTYKYYCRRHPTMKGTLVVTGSGGGVGPVPVQFKQPLKLPPVITSSSSRIAIKQADVQVMPTGPKTRMWTYDGTFPGPTIHRVVGYDTKVTFTDDLPAADGSLSVHLHGDHHSTANDGQPASYLIGPGQSHTYDYALSAGHASRSEFDFYHDHRMGETSRNNWYGLQGMFLVDSTRERKLGLPAGGYDLPLDVTDRSFDSNNQLIDPATTHQAPPNDATTGDHILVDGRYAPYAHVSTHRYRLRLLNSSNFSSYDFRLSGGKAFDEVGNGNGLFPHPVKRTDIALGPAQRADVIVSFDDNYGQNILLETGTSAAATPIMDFQVSSRTTDSSKVPSNLVSPPPLTIPKTVSHTWNFGFNNSSTNPAWTIDGRTYDPNRIDYVARYGSTQLWALHNSSDTTHYVHLHEEAWHTVLRDGKAPPAWERGLEDTWRLDPGETVEVASQFTDYLGVFMIHCHMLDHEDDGMMAQFAVEKPGAALPAGLYLAGSPADRSAQAHAVTTGMAAMGSMSKTPGGAASHVTPGAPAEPESAASPAWRRVLALFGGAFGIELAVLVIGFGLVVTHQRRRRRGAARVA